MQRLEDSRADPSLDPERCYRAIRLCDARFDGRFFTGVKTTGVFCRPVCPAPVPKKINCTFWLSAAAAQVAGFRPCLRCRPETAPGTPAWPGMRVPGAFDGFETAARADPTLLQPGAGLREDIERWVALPGIGPWTAHYVAMRVLREPDALPAADLVLRKAISGEGEKPRSAKEVEENLKGYQPYRAYAVVRLWSCSRPDREPVPKPPTE